MGLESAKVIADIFLQQKQLGVHRIASLDLQKNLLRDAGIKLIMDAIQTTKAQIVAINFSNNELSHKGLEHICKGLLNGVGKYMTSICLSNEDPLQKNRFGWQGGKVLADYLAQSKAKPELFVL